MEAANKVGIKINVVTYDEQLNRIREHYTHDDVKLKDIIRMMIKGGQADDVLAQAARCQPQSMDLSNRKLKLHSLKARLKADIKRENKDAEEELNEPVDSTTQGDNQTIQPLRIPSSTQLILDQQPNQMPAYVNNMLDHQ